MGDSVQPSSSVFTASAEPEDHSGFASLWIDGSCLPLTCQWRRLRPGSRASARRMKPVLPDKHNHHAEGVCSVARGGGAALHAPCFGDVCGDLHHGEEGRGRRRRRARWREGRVVVAFGCRDSAGIRIRRRGDSCRRRQHRDNEARPLPRH
ncbi:unnamed protein product, partial [Ectocarpus sp. 12 AP-2014]